MESLSHNDIEEIRKEEAGDVAMIREYRRYARGAQNRVVTPEMRKALGSRKIHPLADNVLHLILSTAASRLDLTAWSVAPDPKAVDPETGEASEEAVSRAGQVAAYLEGVYVRNQMGRKQFDVNYAQLRDGNHAVSLGWKKAALAPGADPLQPRDGRVTIHREPWWDGKAGIFVATDESDEPLWAVKEWTERGGKERRVIYYDDRFERYVKDAAGWRPLPLLDDPTAPDLRPGVVPWRRRDGRPLGLPIVHFPNGTDDDSSYGRSDLTGLLSLQDDLNSIQVDISAAALFSGFQIIWVAGEKGNKPIVIGPGAVLEFESHETKTGAIPPGPMDSLTTSHRYKRETMAVDTATPMHMLSGVWPSGDALIRAEMPLVDKVVRLARISGPQWVQVGHRSCEIYNEYGGGRLDENAPITAVFAAPERLDPITVAEVQSKQVGVYNALALIPDDTLFRKAALAAGILDAGEIEEVLAERKKAREVMEAQLKAGVDADGKPVDDEEDDGAEPPVGTFG